MLSVSRSRHGLICSVLPSVSMVGSSSTNMAAILPGRAALLGEPRHGGCMGLEMQWWRSCMGLEKRWWRRRPSH